MKTFSFYADLAKEKAHLKSNNQLASAIGLSSASVTRLINGKSLPMDDTLLRVANLAKVSPEEALIDLSIWRNQGNPQTLKVWQRISEILKSKG